MHVYKNNVWAIFIENYFNLYVQCHITCTINTQVSNHYFFKKPTKHTSKNNTPPNKTQEKSVTGNFKHDS